MARHGGARFGKVWLGTVRQSGHGPVRRGMAGKARHGKARQSEVGWGTVRLGRHGTKGVKYMTYKWKIPVFPIDAQSAGEELERIKSTKGRIDPASVLNESRDDGAVLHECFEWDDAVAAEQHRLTQARKIITNIVTVNVGDKRAQEPVRAFVHICDGYKPVAEVMASVAYTEEMLAKALKELLTFRSKYRTLSELQGVMKSIDALETEIEAEKGKEMQLNPVDRPPTQLTASP